MQRLIRPPPRRLFSGNTTIDDRADFREKPCGHLPDSWSSKNDAVLEREFARRETDGREKSARNSKLELS